MLVGRRYRLQLHDGQAAYSELVASICRAVWNLCLDQRQADDQVATGLGRKYRRRVSYASQCRELAELKQSEPWLREAPSHCLQQTLRDLDKACATHGPWVVNFRARYRWEPSFRFPDAKQISDVQRLSKSIGAVKLPKLGSVRFRWSRPLDGTVRNVTVQRDGRHWYITFCVEDGVLEVAPNGKPPVGIDRGVVVPVASSDGQCFDGVGMRPGEQRRLRHLQRRLAGQKKGSNRRRRTVRAIGRVFECVRNRRTDFCHQTAHTLTTEHGLVVIEDLRVKSMTASARGTRAKPGRRVRQKAGLNRSILDKSWGRLRTTLEWHGRKNGCEVVPVPAAYTSQTCSACGQRHAESRESQARFRCVGCGHQDNADVNAAQSILAAGLAVIARGGQVRPFPSGPAGSMKREPPDREVAYVAD